MHSYQDVCALFSIDPRTLRRWCRRAGIFVHRDPVDERRRFLTDTQVLLLSRQHKRVLIIDTESVQLSAIDHMERRIAQLERKVQD